MIIPLNPKLFDTDVEQAPIPNQQISVLGEGLCRIKEK
ncbi:MAG: hypothetical protein UY07_C0027G0012 [Parcubacteria group bacterium GW2011_GWA1_47_8]|nr:MAG: hypothetical protein UY07_C0027G0012 [Parcubacteria group bacterium GW2011_GWA1_47_8]KKW07035.1 MAG: hypothetical protein UY42_C0019G0001 [Parcubacteria group bacterium GW2011_GWA2_49_16]